MKETETVLGAESRTGRMGRRRRRMSRRNGSTARTPSTRPAMEQFLKENAAGLTFLGMTLGVFVSRKFLVLPLAVALMMAQEKLVGAGLDRVREIVRR